MGFILDTIDAVSDQIVSNREFEDGSNGRPPTVVYTPRRQEVYDRSYQKGQESAKTRLLITANGKLKVL
jgi:hypothetical protein